MTAKERREEREYFAKVDAALDEMDRTDPGNVKHKAKVARLQALRDASGETARMNALGLAAQRKMWACWKAERGV
jgi:hypothetical protein